MKIKQYFVTDDVTDQEGVLVEFFEEPVIKVSDLVAYINENNKTLPLGDVLLTADLAYSIEE